MKSKLVALTTGLAFGLAALSPAQVTKPQVNPDGTLNKIAGLGITQKLGADIPLNLNFKDENGQDVRLSQYFGRRPVLLNLIFYKCKAMCSLELDGLVTSFTKMSSIPPSSDGSSSAYTVLGKDVDILSVSIDPNEGPADAAARKKDVLVNFKDNSAAQGWHFLTGDLDNLNKLCTAVGFAYTYNPVTKGINHPAGIMLLSPTGKVTQYFYGTGYPEKPLHDAIALAAKNTVGPRAQVLLLGCLCRDALTGKYTVNVERSLQVFGSLTVLILALSIWRMGHRKSTDLDEEGAETDNG